MLLQLLGQPCWARKLNKPGLLSSWMGVSGIWVRYTSLMYSRNVTVQKQCPCLLRASAHPKSVLTFLRIWSMELDFSGILRFPRKRGGTHHCHPFSFAWGELMLLWIARLGILQYSRGGVGAHGAAGKKVQMWEAHEDQTNSTDLFHQVLQELLIWTLPNNYSQKGV